MKISNTRRGFTQTGNVQSANKGNIPELVSGSSTHIIAQQPQQAWKMPKQVRQYTYFTHRGFTLIELLVAVLIIGILAAGALHFGGFVFYVFQKNRHVADGV